MPSGHAVSAPLRLDFYCVEAVRRQCLCAALQLGETAPVPRLRFSFVSVQPSSSGSVDDLNLAQAEHSV